MKRRLTALLLLLLLPVSGCKAPERPEETAAQTAAYTETAPGTPLGAEILSPTGCVSLLPEGVRAYLKDAPDAIAKYADGSREDDLPLPVAFAFTADTSSPVSLLLWEEGDETPSVFPTEDGRAQVWNLKAGTNYLFALEADGKRSETFRFSTEGPAPRLLRAPGVPNLRDAGGWETENGRVKQGMLCRGSRLNATGAEEVISEMTAEGEEAMKSLGIRTEIDLRMTANGETCVMTSSLLGKDTVYVSVPMRYQTENGILRDEENKKAIAKVFSILAKEENYPILFHCNIGTDRTGAISFLLGALLGMKEEDLVRDYLLSDFAPIGNARSASTLYDQYFPLLASTGEKTLRKQAETLLASFGVPAEEMNQIRKILSEGG